MKLSLAAIALVGLSSAAMAADMPSSNMVGKHLLDANGTPIGQVVGMADHGQQAVIATPDGHRIKMDTSRITQGDGQNTLIAVGGSQADELNRIDRHAPIANGE
ncbi:MAG TPA: hypothetical protein VL574_13095 [Stellaceae bacterium]|jgi:hypothetical protein|nr:hypothetical protein [Stellaceae bacterium]